MLPPETMQTMRSPGTRPRRCGRDRQGAGALGDDPCALGEEADGRGGLVERHGERAGEQIRVRAPTSASGAPGCLLRRRTRPCTRLGRGSPASSAAATGAPVSGSTA